MLYTPEPAFENLHLDDVRSYIQNTFQLSLSLSPLHSEWETLLSGALDVGSLVVGLLSRLESCLTSTIPPILILLALY